MSEPVELDQAALSAAFVEANRIGMSRGQAVQILRVVAAYLFARPPAPEAGVRESMFEECAKVADKIYEDYWFSPAGPDWNIVDFPPPTAKDVATALRALAQGER